MWYLNAERIPTVLKTKETFFLLGMKIYYELKSWNFGLVSKFSSASVFAFCYD